MRKAFMVCGLGFGDCGKGATVDFLARQHPERTLVVRYNGGPQAGHNVVTPDGREHTFSQFGAGTSIPSVRTHLSRFTLINPPNMLREEKHLRQLGIKDAFDRLTVDEGCVVITPYQKAINRLLEWSRGNHAHGTCGQGVGQARSDHIAYGDRVLFARDLSDAALTKEKLEFLQSCAMEVAADILRQSRRPSIGAKECREHSLIIDTNIEPYLLHLLSVPLRVVSSDAAACIVDQSSNLIFEGAQGVLLDETFGTAPHNTWTDTTCKNANSLLAEWDFEGEVRRIGVLRSYFTRHGAGPFPTESSRLTRLLPDQHNDDKGFQGAFRIGYFDAVMARYAIEVSEGVSEIAMNHLDALPKIGNPVPVRTSRPFEVPDYEPVPQGEFVERVEQLLGLPVTIRSHGPTADERAEVAIPVGVR